MKYRFLPAACFAALMAFAVPSFAQSLSSLALSRDQLGSVIGGMGLSMGQKMSLRTILQTMQQQGAKVRQNNSLTDEQKVTQILQIRQNALTQTGKILNPAQQQQLAALLLPKQ